MRPGPLTPDRDEVGGPEQPREGEPGRVREGEPGPARDAGRPAGPRSGRPIARPDLSALAGYAVPFTIVLYLALEGGGYGPIVRGEVGLIVWWVVLVGALAGFLSVAPIGRAGWIALALLTAFVAWTGLSAGWSESSERSVTELGRTAAHLGVLVLGLCVQGAVGVRRAVCGVGAAIAVVGAVALLSRLHPGWFPNNEAPAFIGEAGRRLGYPLNYWNGLAALIAIGLPPLLWIATSARHLAARALAAAAVPALALTAYFTLSRGGAVEIGIGLVALLALHPRRLALVPTLLATGAGSAALVVLGASRGDLADGLATPTAASQGDEMIVLTLVVCGLVGAAQVMLRRAERRGFAPRLAIPGRVAAGAAGAAALLAVVAAAALGAPGEVSDAWEEFKDPAGPADVAERFESTSGNGRYQYWSSLVDAARAEPLTGIGAGTFEFWWAREGTRTGFVRDAHSLYFEALGELGVVGLSLIGGLIVLVLVTGASRALRGSPRSPGAEDALERRSLLAAATAAAFAFAAAVALDWVWDVFVIPAAFLILAAAILAADPVPPTGGDPPLRRAAVATRAGLALLSVAAMVAIAIPLAASSEVRESQAAVRAGDLEHALESARSAASVQPYAATPRLQEALVLELLGDLDAAAAAAREATEAEASNWRPWQVLSRLEAKRGNVGESIAAYRRARALNPRSPLFAR